jgi:signal transduction histidine kinase
MDATHDPRPLTRADSALRYGAAALMMLLFGAVWVSVVERDPSRLGVGLLDAALAVVALVLLRWRRASPLLIALVTALLTFGSIMATGPAFVAYVSLCTHRLRRQIAIAAAALWVSRFTGDLKYVDASPLTQQTVVTMTALTVSLVTLTISGLYLRGLRDLRQARAEQEAATEREERERVEQIKLGERERIAREMHDVLAHRLSLLALHAGALAHRTDLEVDEIRAIAVVIQDNAHHSLVELRHALGQLREATSAGPPQPTFSDLGSLFDEVRAAGQEVAVTDAVTEPSLVPTQIGRHAYRVVQESLTNARKHAPTSPVQVDVSGAPGSSLRVQVSNPLDDARAASQGDGMGLIGLSERMLIVNGDLRYRVDDGRFVLTAALPWPVQA